MALYTSKVITSALALVFSLLCVSTSFASKVTVSWDQNAENDLAGYSIYIGEQSGTYTGVVDVGSATEFVWNNLDDGKTYYFAVTAYDFSGNESDFSQEVSATPGGLDNNPPELVSVVVQGETQLDVIFSEPLSDATAENTAYFAISDGIAVFGAVLDNNQTTVHLITSAHQRGRSYVLSVSNIEDSNGNKIASGSSKSYTIPDPTGDSTPPQINNVTVVDASHLDILFSEAVTQQTGQDKNNYEVNNGVDVLQASLRNQSTVRLTTTAHQNGTYRLTINNIRDLADNSILANSSFSYDMNIDANDNTSPQLSAVVINGATQIDLNFSEPVEKSSAENKGNYSINSGIEVIGAILDDNNKNTVHLITSAHADEQNYTLRVNNVRDRAADPNTISPNSEISYIFKLGDRFNPGNNNGVTPQTFALFQNYPNPFNPETEIRFFVEKRRKIELKVYNPLGQLVKTLVNSERPAGFHTIVWDGTNNDNVQVPSGMYVYSLEVKRQEQRGDLLVPISLERRVMRMTLLR